MKPIDPNAFEPGSKSATDIIHSILSGALSQIPLVDKLFELVFAPPAESRKINWLNVLTATVNELITTHEKSEQELRENKALLTTVIRCSDISFRNMDKNIWEALRGAIISTATAENPRESENIVYLNTLSQLTGLHIELIKFYAACKRKSPVAARYGLEDESIFFKDVGQFSDKLGDSVILPRIATDLHTLNIIVVPHGFPKSLSASNFINMRLSKFGEDFLSYIDPNKGTQRD